MLDAMTDGQLQNGVLQVDVTVSIMLAQLLRSPSDKGVSSLKSVS